MEKTGKMVVVLIAAMGLVLTGCRQGSMVVSVPETSTVSGHLDYHDYDRVLNKSIDKGLVKFRSLQKCRGLLDGFVNSIAQVGPRSTPANFGQLSQDLAFWLNVHNAAALQAAVNEYPEQEKKRRLSGPGSAERVRVLVDGEYLSLVQMADRARAAGRGDPRVDVALSWPRKGSGEYLSEAYVPDRIETQLAQVMRRALDNPQLVKVDHERKTLFLGAAIYRNRERYVEIYERRFATQNATIINGLAMYADANQRRRLNTALGYRVVQTPFDWTLSEKEEPACSLDE